MAGGNRGATHEPPGVGAARDEMFPGGDSQPDGLFVPQTGLLTQQESITFGERDG